MLSILNSINSSIQFTMEYSEDAIPFLDSLINLNNDRIWMERCFKKYIKEVLRKKMISLVEDY